MSGIPDGTVLLGTITQAPAGGVAGTTKVMLDGASTANTCFAGDVNVIAGDRVSVIYVRKELYVVNIRDQAPSHLFEEYVPAAISSMASGWNNLTASTPRGSDSTFAKCWDTTTNSFIMPVRGIYHLSMSSFTGADSGAGRYVLQFSSGASGAGTIYTREENDVSASGYAGCSIDCEILFPQNAHVYAAVFASSGFVGVLSTQLTMSVRLVRRTP